MSAERLQNLHEELPLDDEEFSRGQRAETLVYHDEKERSKPGNKTEDVPLLRSYYITTIQRQRVSFIVHLFQVT